MTVANVNHVCNGDPDSPRIVRAETKGAGPAGVAGSAGALIATGTEVPFNGDVWGEK